MKRVWIAIALIFIVVWGCIASQQYLNNFTSELAGYIYRADSLAQQGDFSDSVKLVQSSYKKWNQKEDSVGAIVRHQEMDNIEALYIRTLQSAVNQDKNEYLLHSKELEAQLLHLADMEKPKAKNIF